MTIDQSGQTPLNRVLFYLIWDSRGHIANYIPYKLERLRPFFSEIHVVVNGELSDDGRATLDPLVDSILVRENVGLDVAGYQQVLAEFGDERLAEFDELVLMNYTWFGPVRDFAPVFDRMESAGVDFWGMTMHGEVTPSPITFKGTMPAHIQSHWIAVRQRMFSSADWADYWRTMPPIESYSDSILNHESRFTQHFSNLGYSFAVAFPLEDYGVEHPAFTRAEQLMRDGCPVLKRRPFFHDPLYLDREAVIGRRLVETATLEGYPSDLIFDGVVRDAKPRVLNTNASMLEVLPDVDISYDPERPQRILAVAHLYYEDLIDELLDRVALLPSPYDLLVTTTDGDKAAVIQAAIERRDDPGVLSHQVRILDSNRGRDLSSFFIAARDLVRSGNHDLVVKVHTKKTVQQGAAAGEFFKRQQLENLLHTQGYAANLVALFQKEPGLGIVFPPMIHIGYPTMGWGWFIENKKPTKALAKKAGISVPLDDVSPLAAYGAMWVARPEALELLMSQEWSYDDYLSESEHRDGSLAHVQERIVAYAAAELGYHTRTVMNTEYAAISHTFMEYKLDQAMSNARGYALESLPRLKGDVHVAGLLRGAGRKEALRYLLIRYFPKLARALASATKPIRRRTAIETPE